MDRRKRSSTPAFKPDAVVGSNEGVFGAMTRFDLQAYEKLRDRQVLRVGDPDAARTRRQDFENE
jgi:FAD/FMN-containing dehydrogenase